MTNLIPYEGSRGIDPLALGKTLAASGYFQDARDAAQAAVKVMAGAELGFGPIASMTGVYIVKGKVSLSANLMAAAIKRSGRYNYRVRAHSEQVCEIEFFEGSESIGKSEFSIKDAAAAGLTSNDTWKKFPKNMLFSRALSNGAKWYCPDIFGGPIYTPDEMGAVIDGETGEILEAAPRQAEPPVAPPKPLEPTPVAVVNRQGMTPEQELLKATIKERFGGLSGQIAEFFNAHGVEMGKSMNETVGPLNADRCVQLIAILNYDGDEDAQPATEEAQPSLIS